MDYVFIFDNTLAFNQLLELPIPYLNDLVEAQLKVRNERAKLEAEAMRQSRDNASSERRGNKTKAW